MNKKPTSPEQAARYAAVANAGIAVSQFFATGMTGNLGFLVEASHNTADALSFESKRRAMNSQISPDTAKKWRNFGAKILTLGGAVGVVGGISSEVMGRAETSDTKAIAFAVGSASVNALVAYKAHKSVDDQISPGCQSHVHREGAHRHTKLHAFSDAGTGFIYAGALMAQNRLEDVYPSIANYAVILVGMISVGVGIKMSRDIKTTC